MSLAAFNAAIAAFRRKLRGLDRELEQAAEIACMRGLLALG